MMKTVELQRLSDPLGRYYTSSDIGNFLVNSINARSPKLILDLGSGTGTLSLAARNRWNDATIMTVDVDSRSTEKILSLNNQKNSIANLQHHVADALDRSLHKILGISLGDVDISICNPPYTRPEWKPELVQILEETGLSSVFDKIEDSTSDVLFLAQNLRLLKKKGKLGLIVPGSLITGEKYKKVRKMLIQCHDIQCCIKLPRGAFKRTDAQAYILIVNKGKPQSAKISLKQIERDKLSSREIFIDPEQAIKRLDFGYYFNQATGASVSKEYSGTIHRGIQSSSDVKRSNSFIFHTCDFPENIEDIPFFNYRTPSGTEKPNIKSHLIAESGDILIARVHRNLEEKVCLVKRGKFPFSDCIYRIRLEKGTPEKLAKFLVSNEGKNILKAISSGVSARHISKKSLYETLFDLHEK